MKTELAEVWRSVPRVLGYEVSSFGRVKSLLNSRGNPRKAGSVFLKPWLQFGYPWVGFGKQGRSAIHVLVLETFVGPRPDGMQACHNNGNRSDPRLTNLRWDTPKNNQADRLDHGTLMYGESHHITTLTENEVLAIRALALTGLSQRKIAKRFGVVQATVWNIIHRKTWIYV